MKTSFLALSLILSTNLFASDIKTFPGDISPTIPELDSVELKVNDLGRGLYFVAWSYNNPVSVSSKGQQLCKFLGFEKYVSSLIEESSEDSLPVAIYSRAHVQGSKYTWGWKNSFQDEAYPHGSNYRKVRGGFHVPFMIFKQISCQ